MVELREGKLFVVKNKKLLGMMLLSMPLAVFASSGDSSFDSSTAVVIQAFMTIHISAFVLWPLADILSKGNNTKGLFWKIFGIRVGILLLFDIFGSGEFITTIDIIILFLGAFTLWPICSVIRGRRKGTVATSVNNISEVRNPSAVKGITLKCSFCGTELSVSDKVCTGCGAPFEGDNVVVVQSETKEVAVPPKDVVTPANYDKMYSLSEDQMLEEFINRELVKCGINKNERLIPEDILKRKKVFNIIFAVLLFAYISLIFFHFPLLTYAIGLLLLIIFFILTRKYSLVKYLKKQLKARPSEKISNIVRSVKSSFVSDNTRLTFIISLVIAVVLPLFIFVNPRIMYEKMDGGYGVRFYTFGVTNMTSATIPESYKGKPVISLRGNTFSNMPFLKKVVLPDSVTEIRGQAFKNDISLTIVNIPERLEYLGGGAFYGCTSLVSIEFPDTLTYMGGETFYKAKSLKSVKLSNNLEEIRGDSFEYCTSLESITIPDSVRRIGGHAFYGDSSLHEVKISENSKLNEIGSSAFRLCPELYDITLPKGVDINERAFKESPTDVKEYGEFTSPYSQGKDSAYSYEKNISLYLLIGDKEKINQYNTSAKLQNAYVRLDNIIENNGYYEYSLTYIDANGVETPVYLTKDNRYKLISDIVAFEIRHDYVFKGYRNMVYLDIYYN